MQITGKVYKLEPVESGVSRSEKPWMKQTLVLETQDEYRPHVAITFFGEEKVNSLKSLSEGLEVCVYVNLSSRHHNGRWYSSIDGWKFELDSSTPASSHLVDDDDLNF